jgi:D-alanyl-D-alanine carboxypeptidase/D-alanyl-D-alanine endopeptidase (penicillin-binding protein 7)
MLKVLVVTLLVCYSCMCWSAVTFRSERALVVDEGTGEVLLDKNADSAAPIASMTKLMTLMVVLDQAQDPDEMLTVQRSDRDSRERIKTCLPVGSMLPRHTMVTLALLASDNHAAAALARTFDGGRAAFDAAMQQKIAQLNLTSTVIEEPTGLSPRNTASAQDLVKMLTAAEAYPEITEATSQASLSILVNGHVRDVHNTNGLVGSPGWDISLSKTGTTLAAGRCLAMRIQSAGRSVFVVLMGAVGRSARAIDALSVRRLLTGQAPPALQTREVLGPKLSRGRVKSTRVAAL